MAKKLGKFMLFSALAGAAAAGTYYCLHNKNNASDEDFDEYEESDGFDKDLEDEDFSADSTSSKHSHLPIDIDNAKEKIGEKVIETLDKTKEKLEHFNVSERIDKAKEFIGEMTSPAAQPAYTQMDMSATTPQSTADVSTDTATTEEPSRTGFDNPSVSISSTYADNTVSEDSTKIFFDDSKTE